jgi:ankyrin repeat protein
LIEAKCNVNALNNRSDNALFRALKEGSYRTVQSLIRANCNVNQKNNDGDTPLHYANSITNITKLIGAGAHLDILNKKYQTPLHNRCSSIYEYDEVMMLIGSKCNVSIQDEEGNLPLHLILKNKPSSSRLDQALKAVVALIDAKSDIWINNKKGESSLSLMVRNNFIERIIRRDF